MRQLPQLNSPSMPLIKLPSTVSIGSPNEEDYEEEKAMMRGCSNIEKVTDWRDLDKFVASQLSHGERSDEGERVSEFGRHENTDMALLLLQSSGSSREEGSKINELLSSGSVCDIGICIFEK